MENEEPKTGGADLQRNELLCTPCGSHAFLSPEECAEIRRISKDLASVDGVLESDPENKPSTGIRQTEVKWLPPGADTSWIYKKIMQTVSHINRHYKYDISGIESIQIGRYAEGGFYDWHMDVGNGAPSLRKISVSVQLSDAADYEGGELQFRTFSNYKSYRDLGSVIVFPSYLLHRVTPVTKGVRWSLVAWVIGPPFR